MVRIVRSTFASDISAQQRILILLGITLIVNLACNLPLGDQAAEVGGGNETRVTTVPPPVFQVPATALPSPLPIQGQTYYLGQVNCSDAGAGRAQTPFCSYPAAAQVLQPGDELVIRNGVYAERLDIEGLHGTSQAPVTIRGQSRQGVIFDGGCPEFPCGLNDVAWKWDEETGMVSVRDSEFVTLRDVSVRNSLAVGVDVVAGQGITVQGVLVSGTGHAGMLFRHTRDLKVIGNQLERIQLGWLDENDDLQVGAHETLSVVAVQSFEAADNILRDSLKEGLDVKESSTDGDVHDNFIERTCLVGLYINEAQHIAVHANRIRRSGYFLNASGQELPCEQQPYFGDLYGKYYGSGIQMSVGDLGDLSTGLLEDIRIYQNVVWGLAGNGLETWNQLKESGQGQGSMTSIQIYNNVFYDTAMAGIRLEDAQHVSVANNILALNAGGSFSGNAVDSSAVRANLFESPGEAVGEDPMTGDPLFVDPAAGDFHLLPGSPAIDAGGDVGLPFQGAAPDLGAYEY